MIGACAECNVRKKDKTVEEYCVYFADINGAELHKIIFYGDGLNLIPQQPHMASSSLWSEHFP